MQIIVDCLVGLPSTTLVGKLSKRSQPAQRAIAASKHAAHGRDW